jgi:hypothetical protein
MNESLRLLVWSRAGRRCEYCQLPQACDPLPFGVDHIKAQFHRGPMSAENLALACFSCNTFKGCHAAGFDPDTGEITRLFHPRADRWDKHFSWIGAELVGTTAIGRTTIDVLRINLPERIEHRRLLIELGEFVTHD